MYSFNLILKGEIMKMFVANQSKPKEVTLNCILTQIKPTQEYRNTYGHIQFAQIREDLCYNQSRNNILLTQIQKYVALNEKIVICVGLVGHARVLYNSLIGSGSKVQRLYSRHNDIEESNILLVTQHRYLHISGEIRSKYTHIIMANMITSLTMFQELIHASPDHVHLDYFVDDVYLIKDRIDTWIKSTEFNLQVTFEPSALKEII